MNTAQLECFISLAKTLNYVKTADQLNLTQPAVSKQIKSLENELGARLFDRTTRSVTLSQVGQQFLPEATTMLNTYYHSIEWISNFNVAKRHALRIGYSDPHCINIIQTILKDLLRDFPNLTPDLTYDQTDANLSRLTLGQLDLVLGMRDARFSDDNIIFHKLHEDKFICVVEKEHPLLEDLATHHGARYDVCPGKTDTISSDFLWNYRQVVAIPPYLLKNYYSRGQRIIPVNDNLDNYICSNTNEAYGLVLSGLGYAMIPEHLIMMHPDLVFLNWIESPHSGFGIYYRRESGKNKSSALVKFMELADRQK